MDGPFQDSVHEVLFDLLQYTFLRIGLGKTHLNVFMLSFNVTFAADRPYSCTKLSTHIARMGQVVSAEKHKKVVEPI